MSDIVRVNGFAFSPEDYRPFEYEGQPVWSAAEMSLSLGYSSNKKIGQAIREDWKDDFILDVDYAIVKGNEKIRALFGNPKDTRQSAVVLYESGVHMACIKTEKPLGKALRRFLVTYVMPSLHRDQDFPKEVPMPPPEKPRISKGEFKAAHKILRAALKYGQMGAQAYHAAAIKLYKDWTGMDLVTEPLTSVTLPSPPEGYKTLEEMRCSFEHPPRPLEFASKLNRMHVLGNTNYLVHVPIISTVPYYSPDAIKRVHEAFKEIAEVPVADVTGYMTAKDAGVQLKNKLKQLRIKRHRMRGKKGDPSELTDKGYGDMFADLMRELRLHPLPSKEYAPTQEDVLASLDGKYAMVREMVDVTIKDGAKIEKSRPHAMFGYNAIVAAERLIKQELAAA